MVQADAPLAQLARLATLCRSMRAVYQERLGERRACIQERLARGKQVLGWPYNHWAAGWTDSLAGGLTEEHMAVPRDLVVTPEVCSVRPW
jgi:hypothetical protein